MNSVGVTFGPPRGPKVRMTRQGAAVWGLLENLEEFRSAKELHDELRRRGEGIGLTTVYRRLRRLLGRRSTASGPQRRLHPVDRTSHSEGQPRVKSSNPGP